MRSFAKVATVLLTLVSLSAALAAQSANARQVYTDALKREAELRREMDAHTASEPVAPLLQRIRTLVGAYSDMARLFPGNEQGDNALWQGAILSADTFWRFGDEIDRAAALNLLDALTARFPQSPRTAQAAPHVERLASAPVLTPVPPFSGERPATRADAAPPAVAPALAPAPAPVVTAATQEAPAASASTAPSAAAAATPQRPAALPIPALPDATDAASSADRAAGQSQTAAARPAAPGSALPEPGASSSPRTTSAAASPTVDPPAPARLTEPPAASAITSRSIAPAPAGTLPAPAPDSAPVAAVNRQTPPPAAAVPATGSDVARASAVAPAPTVAAPAGPARLTAISGESMGEAIRFTLSLDGEVAVRHHQLGGPPRIVIDLQDTVPAETLTQAMLPAGADVISRIRVGRHDGTWTRIVIELRAPSRYAVFVAQDPHRVLVEVHPRLAGLSTDAGAGASGRHE